MKMGVDQPFIDEVNLWDGKTDLQADEDSEKQGADQEGMDEDEIPTPPARVIDAYREATPLLHKLGEDPHNYDLLK